MLKNLHIFTLSLGLTAGVVAGELDSPKASPVVIPEESGWDFQIAPYIWFAGLTGTTGVPALPPSEVDASFGDIWDNLDFAGFIAMEANKDKWRLFADLQYINLGADADLPNGRNLELDVEQVRLELGVGYEVYSNETTSLSLYTAAIYNYLDQTLSSSGLGSRGTSESWVDPAVGFTLRHRFTDKWKAKLSGEYGGFEVSSDETWQVLALLGYDINEKWALIGGYRHQSIDYEDGGFIYDTETYGPFLGASYSF